VGSGALEPTPFATMAMRRAARLGNRRVLDRPSQVAGGWQWASNHVGVLAAIEIEIEIEIEIDRGDKHL